MKVSGGPDLAPCIRAVILSSGSRMLMTKVAECFCFGKVYVPIPPFDCYNAVRIPITELVSSFYLRSQLSCLFDKCSRRWNWSSAHTSPLPRVIDSARVMTLPRHKERWISFSRGSPPPFAERIQKSFPLAPFILLDQPCALPLNSRGSTAS